MSTSTKRRRMTSRLRKIGKRIKKTGRPRSQVSLTASKAVASKARRRKMT
jgi:hypothetical protein